MGKYYKIIQYFLLDRIYKIFRIFSFHHFPEESDEESSAFSGEYFALNRYLVVQAEKLPEMRC